MKLREFIKQLQDHDQEAEVVFEGKVFEWVHRDYEDPPAERYEDVDAIGRNPGSLTQSKVVISISHEVMPC